MSTSEKFLNSTLAFPARQHILVLQVHETALDNTEVDIPQGISFFRAIQAHSLHIIPLSKPSQRNNRQFLPQLPKMSRLIYNHDHSLLNRGPRNLRRSISQQGGSHLSRARYPEQGGRRRGGRRIALQGEVGEIFGRPNAATGIG